MINPIHDHRHKPPLSRVSPFTGYEAYFPVSNLHMHVPTDAKLIDELKGMPIHQFTMNHFPDNHRVDLSHCRFEFEQQQESEDMLTIGVHSGDISLGSEFKAQGK